MFLWNRILGHARRLGFDELFTVIPKNDPMIVKFDKMFGFRILSEDEDTILMVRDL